MNVNDFVSAITSSLSGNYAEYVTEHISKAISTSLKNRGPLDVDQDTATLIGIAAASAVTVAVEISATATAALFSELGILELDETPLLHIVPDQKD